MSSITSLRRIAFAGALAGTALAAASALAAERFSFRTVEFMPDQERLPAARAFVQQAAAPGAPLAQAVAALRGAGAYCGTPSATGVRCVHSSTERPTGEDLHDVTWRVDVTAAGGAVSGATVERTVAGV